MLLGPRRTVGAVRTFNYAIGLVQPGLSYVCIRTEQATHAAT